MSPLTFKYKAWRGRISPIITIGVNHKDQWIRTNAYVDSGASYSVFDVSMADSVGLDYAKCKKDQIYLPDGRKVPIYLSKHAIQIGKKRIAAEIGFLPQLGYGFNILGRKDIFDHFKICFDEKNLQITFHPLNE